MATVTTSMKMTQEHHAAFTTEAKRLGMTLSAWARVAMIEKFERGMAARGVQQHDIEAALNGGRLAGGTPG